MSIDSEIFELLEAAFKSEVGLRVTSSDVDKLRRSIYIYRRKSQDARFSKLSLTVPKAHRDQLWIVHTKHLEALRGDPDE